ncbi:hypothetical protein FE257_002875 [Aspergillus nanangensis]|uniref:Uncharacterized protein n=1 Tax=Aspergillus nanangensis TaxID=2582783 RepID=A0AAD4GWI0_ASPNN|nr:hypothetical protein FE257_002875 [Aspergillus nanangensis]
MRFSILLLASLASMVVAHPEPAVDGLEAANAQCGWPNGNCDQNGCDGGNGAGGITCSAGPYKGCQCGWGCGSNTGRCDENGCGGRDGRCQNAYRGCSCRD